MDEVLRAPQERDFRENSMKTLKRDWRFNSNREVYS